MRIERLSIDGFGHYAGAEFGPFDHGLVLLYGPNEAGKTTLLAFIHAVLFGFPRRNHARAIPPLAGGRHGGRIVLANQHGEHFVVSRHNDADNGRVQVTMPDGSVKGEETLQYLLSNISRDIFQSVFAFGLDQLQTIDSLPGDEVSGRIYGAGLGTEKLPRTLASFDREAQEIFRPNGRLQPVAEALDELDAIEQKIERIRASAAEYHDLVAERRAIDQHLTEIDTQIESSQAEQAALARLQSAWDDWILLCGTDDRLREIEPIEYFPEDGLTRLESVEAEYWAAERERSQAQQSARRASDLANAPIADAGLLEHPEAVEGLRAERASYDRWIVAVPERRETISRIGHEMNSALEELGPGWTEERLGSFDVSIPARDTVERMRTQFSSADEDRRAAERDVQSRATELHEAEHSLERVNERLSELPENLPDSAALSARQDMARQARDRWARLEMARQTLREEESRGLDSGQPSEAGRPAPGWIPPVLSLVGLGLFAVGALLGGAALVVGIIAAVILLLMMGAFLIMNRAAADRRERGSRTSNMREERVRQAKESADQAAADYAAAAEKIDVDPHAGPVALESADAALESIRESVAEQTRLREREREAGAELDRRRERLNECWETLDQATQARTDLRNEWSAWLRSNGLEETLSPDAVLELFNRLELARRSREQLIQARAELRDMIAEIRRYQRQLVPVLSTLGEPLPESSPHAIAAVIDDVIKRYDAARESMVRRAQYQEQDSEERARLQQREQEFESVQARFHELLQAGGGTDAETFRERGHTYEERRRLQNQRQEVMERLLRLSGPGHAWTEFRDRLAGASAAELEQSAARLADRIPDLESRRSDRLSHRGEIEEKIRRLEGDTSGSDLRAQRAMLIEQLREHAREWAIYTTGKAVLTRAQRKFEEERQPAVLRTAQDALRSITDGRYTRIIMPEGDTKRIEVLEASGNRKGIEELSRGTREQLYLSLRFGLIREFGERADPLPVVVDDILVNFDPARARAAGSCFVDLAGIHQVLLFTCHPSTIDIFRDARPDLQVIDCVRNGHG